MRGGRQPVVVAQKAPVWQSPMVLLTGGAILIGIVVIVFALFSTGQIGQNTSVLREPPDGLTPKALWDGRAVGSKTAPVTMEVYEDFQCPVCRIFSENTEPALLADYIEPGKVRMVYKDEIVIGPQSIDGAVAARCADQQGLFWPFHDYLFANQGIENSGYMTADFLARVATKAGLDMTKYNACVSQQSVRDAVAAEAKEGTTRGVTGTPTIFLNGQQLPATTAYSDIKAAIERVLAGGSSSGSASPAASASPSGS